jgi:quercetin dioxygenase-like cupin family protein
MKRIQFLIGATAAAGMAASAFAAGPALPAKPATPATMPDTSTSVISSIKDVKWGPGSPALPPGTKMAVMSGDPSAKGFVSLRAEMPAGYKIPPHFHPTDEHVTVLSGTVMFGSGDTIDAKTAKTLKAGGYFTAAAQMHHYAIAKTVAVLQVDLEGPFEITYVNPADDPRTKKTP